MKTAQEIRDNLTKKASSEQKHALNLFITMFNKATEEMFKEGLLIYPLHNWPYTPMQTKKWGISDYIREHGFEYRWEKELKAFGYGKRRLCIIVPKE